jgi:cytochrome c oxidase subunit IV
MKSEYRIFAGVAAFLFAMAALYGWWSNHTLGSVEWIGVVALILAGLLCSMCGGYFWFVSRRIDPRPEDRHDAEISDGAGEVGFFSPGSYWPVGVALAAITAAIGLAFWEVWIIIIGLVACVVGGAALIVEYYSGTRRAH